MCGATAIAPVLVSCMLYTIAVDSAHVLCLSLCVLYCTRLLQTVPICCVCVSGVSQLDEDELVACASCGIEVHIGCYGNDEAGSDDEDASGQQDGEAGETHSTDAVHIATGCMRRCTRVLLVAFTGLVVVLRPGNAAGNGHGPIANAAADAPPHVCLVLIQQEHMRWVLIKVLQLQTLKTAGISHCLICIYYRISIE